MMKKTSAGGCCRKTRSGGDAERYWNVRLRSAAVRCVCIVAITLENNGLICPRADPYVVIGVNRLEDQTGMRLLPLQHRAQVRRAHVVRAFTAGIVGHISLTDHRLRRRVLFDRTGKWGVTL